MEIKIPDNISPKDFFEEFLPKEHAKLNKDLFFPMEFSTGIEVLGLGGGDWTIEYNHGKLEVFRGIPDEPLFTFSIDISEWKKANDHNLTSIFFSKKQIDNQIMKSLNQKKVDKLKLEHGKINIKVDNVKHKEEIFMFSFSIIIGEPLDSDPELSIVINQKQFDSIKENPQDIYKMISSNNLNTSGDLRYLMKLATIIFF